MVSTDGGATYTALSNANTVDGPQGPALNGDAAGFATQTFDLSAYAGQTVLVGFRYISDGGVNDGGWYVDDVNVGGTLVSDGSSTSAFQSPTQVHPIEVANWNVRLVGLDAAGHRAVYREFDGVHSFRLDPRQLSGVRDVPVGGRDRRLRRADRAGAAVRAIHAHGQRQDAGRRLTLTD